MPKATNQATLRFGMAGCDCDEINRRLDELEANQCPQCCDCEAINNTLTQIQNDITEINNRLTLVENSVEISGVRCAQSTTTQLLGLGGCVISIGPTYNYWGTGTLTSGTQWSQGSTYYLVTPAQFPELAWYQGEPTISTVWVQWGNSIQSLPIYLDQTGIYIRPANTINPGAGATFKFTATLILIPPSLAPTP